MFEKEIKESENLVDLESKLDRLIVDNKEKTYFFEASIAKSLLDKIKKEKARGKRSIKFIAYPNNAGIDIYFGSDKLEEEMLGKKFGWKFYDLG
jgi:hypothetical protein